ncbi:nicotinate-nucleotide diphosphorylase (carboxylating) [Tessaracoccus lapidicaptus]|uniref:Nicotinate-nucleotide pyrophosphorylase [carboxylating] n=1 Tax=Tessaracoccus lapidicaptus TaxID=1427523 RepID=A0A1C0AKZ8_9ACTN|nr:MULTISPECIES: carboxylating nicotinate-nucleotide diphosphorylase [Tessaracoccus]AQX16066.1 nicotinate-nucleotide diphosphorylase (carboxylating) [Tessaracoccus sp. T2.5-30]OCL33367.1 nicotinate-nucleotide diphosphorylase (carboxylating) [Tessaracoccus lapidicaptus]VEP40602.1 Nicotinate-nucleotide pyrophosphorylase [carboxylating] [Tessaracoccus lapidicaptus]
MTTPWNAVDPAEVRRTIEVAVDEDLRLGPDVTTEATVPADAVGVAEVVAREAGVVAGVPVAVEVLRAVASRLGVEASAEEVLDDGSRVAAGDVVLRITGPVRCLLTAERTLLNFLGQLSGVATETAAWVSEVVGTDARIRDTRKTVPGMRALQKYAVVCGGGVNHRMALGDAALIKDNHVAAAGSVAAAFRAVQEHVPGIAIEVECDTVEQVREAVAAGAELVLLDNMTLAETREAVAVCRAAGVRTEASGGLTLDRAAEVAAAGVDYMAVGALTHSAPVLDLGLDLR